MENKSVTIKSGLVKLFCVSRSVCKYVQFFFIIVKNFDMAMGKLRGFYIKP